MPSRVVLKQLCLPGLLHGRRVEDAALRRDEAPILQQGQCHGSSDAGEVPVDPLQQ